MLLEKARVAQTTQFAMDTLINSLCSLHLQCLFTLSDPAADNPPDAYPFTIWHLINRCRTQAL